MFYYRRNYSNCCRKNTALPNQDRISPYHLNAAHQHVAAKAVSCHFRNAISSPLPSNTVNLALVFISPTLLVAVHSQMASSRWTRRGCIRRTDPDPSSNSITFGKEKEALHYCYLLQQTLKVKTIQGLKNKHQNKTSPVSPKIPCSELSVPNAAAQKFQCQERICPLRRPEQMKIQ